MTEVTLVLLTIGIPLAAAAIAAIGTRWGGSRDLLARVACATVGIGFGLSVAIAVMVISSGTIRADLGPIRIAADPLAALMLLLVLGLSAVIQSFAVRYLRGDTRQGWFVASANLLTGCTAVLVCATSLATFATAWLAAGAALLLLLGTYSRLSQAQDGVRRTAVRFAIGDSALVVAVVVLMITAGGDVALDRLGGVIVTLPMPASTVIALLLVLPALARSSQIPFQGWLPATLAAPTPVSALLHAGVVNAGAILVIRFAAVLGDQAIPMTVIFLAGAATLVYASVIRLVKPDVKGRLVYSTMAQMGFMMMACGLGAFTAAVFHLIAHSLFKSTLFLGAGTAVRRHAEQRDWPTREPVRTTVVVASIMLAIIVPAGALTLARATIAPDVSAVSLALVAFVALSGGVTLGAALLVRFSPGSVAIGVAAITALAFGYTAFLAVFDSLLTPTAPVIGASPWLLLLPATALVAMELLARRRGAPSGLGRVVYAHALASTTLTSARTRPTFDTKEVTS